MSLTPFFSANGISVGNLFSPTNVLLANGSITAGNTVSANYFVGNGALLTGIVAGTSYSNANVAAYLPNYQGQISNIDFRSTSPAAVALVSNSRPLTIGGNILSYITIPNDANANVVAAELTNHGLGNVLISSGPDDHEWIFDYTGNLRLPGNTWSVYYANGVQVPLGGAGNYSNANVAAYLASNSNVTITTTGNITGNYIAGNGIAVTTVAATPPANPEQGDIWIRSDTGVQYIYFTSGGNSQWAEMEALQSFSNGSSIVGGYGNVDVAAYLNAGTAGNILPSTNVTYDIGTSTRRWKDIWLANSTIHLGTANISETSGNLVLPANVMIGSQPVTSYSGNLALPAGTTIGGSLVQAPKISNVQIANSGWVAKDDTAVALEGGYILINGSGFVTGATVAINATQSVSASVVSATQIRAQVGAQSAGSYVVYVVNPDGSVAILLNGLTYSGTPTWVTGSILPTQYANSNISIQLTATGANTYAVSAGNTIPTGLSLSSSGLLAGNITTINTDTVYSFSVDAIDTELQESPRAFSLTVTIMITDPYFNQVSLLLPGTGTNNATNNTFLDSSTNNFTITRNGNPTQGSFSPYSPAGWSNYFDGTGDYLQTTSSELALGTGDFTVELWFNVNSVSNNGLLHLAASYFPASVSGIAIYVASGNISMYCAGSASAPGGTVNIGTWNHVAVVRSNGVTKLYLNGTYSSAIGTITDTTNYTGTALVIGGYYNNTLLTNGYISNLRIVKGTAVYTGNFTPPTAPLTAIANTSLLTCQSNRFVDNSTNALAITRNGDTKVTNWAPFAPTAAWSAATAGGSAYFDGNGDYLTATASSFNPRTTVFTLEGWLYPIVGTNTFGLVADNASNNFYIQFAANGAFYLGDGATNNIQVASSGIVFNAWNYVAVSFDGTTYRAYINGTLIGSSTTLLKNITVSTFGIGKYDYTTSTSLMYMSGFRYLNGTALYTGGSMSVPTQPVTAITNTSLLLNFTNAGITDATTRNVVETVGDAKISTAQSKWGGGSMYFDGSGDWLSGSKTWVPTGLEDFTIECWYYPVSKPTNYPAIFASNTTYNGTTGISIYDRHDSYPTKFSVFGCGVTLTSTTLVSNSNWYYVAVSRQYSGGVYTLRLFVNGVLESSATGASGSLAPDSLFIGRADNPSLSLTYLNGYINDFRITKGIARYTANFTPPTGAFPI